MIKEIIEAAYDYINAGVNILPVGINKRPLPGIKWKSLQQNIISKELIKKIYAQSENPAIAIICGRVSGNIECLDFDNHFGDAKEIISQFLDMVKSYSEELFSKFTIQETQNGGYHVIYRCENIGGQTCLAARYNDKGRKESLIETRAEGGYFLAAPSYNYKVIKGSLVNIKNIETKDRNFLTDLARSFDESGDKSFSDKTHSEKKKTPNNARPGDDYNSRGDALSILQKHGWDILYTRPPDIKLLRRPGKEQNSPSATYNAIPGKFYCFSTNADPFENNKAYDNFAIYATLECNGDFNKAAKQLYREGFGEQYYEPDEEKSDKKILEDTDMSAAEMFHSQYSKELLYNITDGFWYYWNGKKWNRDEHQKIYIYLRKFVRAIRADFDSFTYYDKQKVYSYYKKLENTARANSMLTQAESLFSRTTTELDTNLDIINLQNCIYDLKTNKTLKTTSEEYCTKIAGVEYAEKVYCPTWDSMLQMIFNGDDNLIRFVYKALGLSLSGGANEEVLFFCYGIGANGKSTFFDVMRYIFNDYFGKISSEALIETRNTTIPNDLALLPGKRFVISSEWSENKPLNESKIKEMTGNDIIQARFLHKEFFNFIPNYTLWLYGNHKPRIYGTDEGIWRRIKLIPFSVIPESERRPRDIITPKLYAEAPGILKKIIEGWQDYKANGLQDSDAVKRATLEYREDQDRILSYINERCIFKAESSCPAIDLYKDYIKWCEDNSEKPISKIKFYNLVEQKPGVSAKRGGGNKKTFYGVQYYDNPDMFSTSDEEEREEEYPW